VGIDVLHTAQIDLRSQWRGATSWLQASLQVEVKDRDGWQSMSGWPKS
jgi:hypothetical protein